jgi:hypothetical protein
MAVKAIGRKALVKEPACFEHVPNIGHRLVDRFQSLGVKLV